MEYNLSGWTESVEANRLVSAGLNPETSDMYFWEAEGKVYTYVGKGTDRNYQPCWSFGRLIDLMPKRIGYYTLVWDIGGGVIEYKKNLGGEHDEIFVTRFTIPQMVIWLLENGYMNDFKTKKDGASENDKSEVL